MTDGQLRRGEGFRRDNPDGLFIGESTRVIERALAAGIQPLSLLVEERWATHEQPIIDRFLALDPSLPVFLATVEQFHELTGYEVKSIDGQSELSSILQMQSDIANTEDDLSYLASVALDADIYIKYAPEVTNEEVSVEVSAYETSTARLLGSQSAVVRNNGHTSKININSNIGAAVRKAMPGLEQKILNYWKMDLAKGTQYKVVANIKGEYSDSQTEDLHDAIMKGLKGNFSSVKVNVMTAKTLDFVIYANPIKYRDSQEVYSKIRQIFKPIAETKKINITRKLILMELN